MKYQSFEHFKLSFFTHQILTINDAEANYKVMLNALIDAHYCAERQLASGLISRLSVSSPFLQEYGGSDSTHSKRTA